MSRIETLGNHEDEPDETYIVWCSVCDMTLIEDTNKYTAEKMATTHYVHTGHLVLVSSAQTQPYEP